MLSDLEAGRVDGVIVHHLDRLHRRPRELEDFLDVCARAGVRDMACVTGEIDLGGTGSIRTGCAPPGGPDEGDPLPPPPRV